MTSALKPDPLVAGKVTDVAYSPIFWKHVFKWTIQTWIKHYAECRYLHQRLYLRTNYLYLEKKPSPHKFECNTLVVDFFIVLLYQTTTTDIKLKIWYQNGQTGSREVPAKMKAIQFSRLLAFVRINNFKIEKNECSIHKSSFPLQCMDCGGERSWRLYSCTKFRTTGYSRWIMKINFLDIFDWGGCRKAVRLIR